MIERGVLNKDDHVELIRGEIVQKDPKTHRHAWCVTNLSYLSRNLLDQEVIIWNQNAVIVGESEPEPDIVLLKYSERFYSDRRPVVSDVLLIGEVADITLAADREVKIPLYAAAGIPEAWIVNLEDDVIEVYSAPANGAYQKTWIAGKGSTVSLPAGLPGVVSVDEVLS